jgi:ER membrane protein complex subunit 2
MLQGGTENYKVAHTYYARVLELTHGDNVRALYGVLAAKNALEASGEGGLVTNELSSLSRQRLLQLYEHAAPSKVQLVENVLPEEGSGF